MLDQLTPTTEVFSTTTNCNFFLNLDQNSGGLTIVVSWRGFEPKCELAHV